MIEIHLALLRITALTGLVALGGAGGASTRTDLQAAVPPDDCQACAEEALRRDPDPVALVNAALTFELTCATRQPGACSLLGVLHELGVGAPRDLARARSLYRLDCDAGNARACGNLGALMLRDDGGATTELAAMLLTSACSMRGRIGRA